MSERIIFIPFIDAFGGAERLVLDLSRFLHEKLLPHTIACFRQSIELQEYADWPLQIHQILPRRNAITEARSLSAFLVKTRSEFSPLLFDLKSAFYSGLVSPGPFFLHLTDPPSLLPADVSKHARALRRQDETRRAGVLPTLRGDLVHRLNRRGVKRASKTIVMTEKIQSELRELYDVDALIIRPGVPARSFPAAKTQTAGPLRLLSVSRLEANKRIDWILRALAALKPSQPSDWLFEIVGQGPDRELLRNLAAELGLGDRVLFHGHVSDEELNAAYARANLFLMPAVQGYGLPALEALRRGIPSVVHADSGVSEILGGSPWVEIVAGSNGELGEAIGIMLGRLTNGPLSLADAPRIPASNEWAAQICQACEWL